VGSYVVLAGAAIGCFCHAIEPDPESFERLLDNIFLNRIPDRVKAHNIGSASENGILRFLSGLDTINHVISDESPERQYIQVVVKKLDDIVGEDKPIALKIDVEGFETSVIMGSQALLEQETLWAVVMEQNGLGERYGFDEEALHQRMVGEYGFQPVRYDPVKRDLLPKEKNDPYQNQIYVRERSKVLSRLKSAQKYSVFGRAV